MPQILQAQSDSLQNPAGVHRIWALIWDGGRWQCSSMMVSIKCNRLCHVLTTTPRTWIQLHPFPSKMGRSPTLPIGGKSVISGDRDRKQFLRLWENMRKIYTHTYTHWAGWHDRFAERLESSKKTQLCTAAWRAPTIRILWISVRVVASFTGLATRGLFSAAPRLDVTAETAHVVLSFQK